MFRYDDFNDSGYNETAEEIFPVPLTPEEQKKQDDLLQNLPEYIPSW